MNARLEAFYRLDLEAIIADAARVADEVGIYMPEESLRQKAAGEGLCLEGQRVHVARKAFTGYLESWKADGTRGSFVNRGAQDQRSVYSGTMNEYCTNLLSLDGDRYEPFTMDSLASQTQTMLHLSQDYGKRPGLPGQPADVPAQIQSLARYYIAGLHCPEGFPSEPCSLLSAKYMFEMAKVLGDSINRLTVYVSSPLTLGGESLEIAERHAENLDVIKVTSMPALGCTVPLPLPQALAVSLAEAVGSAIIVSQICRKPTDFLVQMHPFDFWDMNFVYGTPETYALSEIITHFNARLRGVPARVGRANIHTMAKTPGVQAAAEKNTMITAGALAGAQMFNGMGALSLDEIFSPVQYVIDAELIDGAQRMVQGFPLEAGTEDLVAAVKKGLLGGFLMSDDTLDNMERYARHSRLFTRKSLATFERDGDKDALERAKDAVRDAQSRPPCYALEDGKARELTALYERARKEANAS